MANHPRDIALALAGSEQAAERVRRMKTNTQFTRGTTPGARFPFVGHRTVAQVDNIRASRRHAKDYGYDEY